MNSADPEEGNSGNDGYLQVGAELPASWAARGQRISRFTLATLLVLFFWGCSTVPEPSEHRSNPTSPAPVQAAAAPEKKSPFDEWIKSLEIRPSKLALAGGAGLFFVILVGVGVRKILRGAAPAPESPG
ncbi:MAG TPA: hypothetical protein VMU54_17235 [Planctomycetota bacterium]|nr:hypothetical protein [Planctomycetota bacterium]